uniref:hypothetical protein n=1 Tax=Sedimenticola sp. TaxID=1940285 RepID=UPI003D117255
MYRDWSQPRTDIHPPIPFEANPAVELLWRLPDSTDLDRHFLLDQLNRYPTEIASAIADRYQLTADKQGKRQANLNLLRYSSRTGPDVNILSMTEEEIQNCAHIKARACKRIRQGYGDTHQAYRALCSHLEAEGYQPAAISQQVSLVGALNRMCHHRWWKRRIETRSIRTYESLAIENG